MGRSSPLEGSQPLSERLAQALAPTRRSSPLEGSQRAVLAVDARPEVGRSLITPGGIAT